MLLVSKDAKAIRFRASDEALRPMGRATSGVIGMRFGEGDRLLGMHVLSDGADVLVATGGGYAKHTPADQYPMQGRGGQGVVTARIVEARGELIGALMVLPEDEVFAITSASSVIRTSAAEINCPASRPWESGWSTWPRGRAWWPSRATRSRSTGPTATGPTARRQQRRGR